MKRQLLAAIVLAGTLPAPVLSQMSAPTRVMVRVTAHDAKIIGSNVGGARVTILNAESKDTLATGIQEGSTGDTRRIMIEPHSRGVSLFDTPGAAGFLAELSLSAPTVVEIIAEGPLGTPHAMQRATKTTLLVPGQDVLGDGVIIELLGYTVVVDLPKRVKAGESFEIRANITMLCGCPTEPDGMWDANEITVVATAMRDGAILKELPLTFAGTTSTYAATLALQQPGDITMRVLAMNRATANFGMAKALLSVVQ